MYDKCVMTWETFLILFKEDYSLFRFNGISWCLKYDKVEIEIILHYNNNIVENNYIVFLNEGEIIYVRPI